MTKVRVFAPAKINLTLHITGRRDDGYHELDSLVAFAHVGDTIEVEEADDLSLAIKGEFARDLLETDDNLVLRAAKAVGNGRGAKVTLYKRLPVAAGIGGGSADAAATVRALCELWDLPWPEPAMLQMLGSDVPVCLQSGLTRMSGIGERLQLLGIAPSMGILLVNPGVAVPTASVFQRLTKTTNASMEASVVAANARGEGFDAWIKWLERQRNDLEAAAVSAFPVIGDVLDELRNLKGCRLARMSGSGATCFAIFDDDAYVNGMGIKEQHPDWWVSETEECPFYFDQSAPNGFVTS